MFEKLLCWFIGHEPKGPIMAFDMDGVDIQIYSCDRCKSLIVFDVDTGWNVW